MQNMRHNFIIILISNFLVAASTTMLMPFLALYIATLGDFSDSYVQTWAGLIFAATFYTTGLLFFIACAVIYFLRKLPIQYMDELLKNHA